MRIALIGYGKMGHMIEEVALKRGHEVVCRIDVQNQDDFDSPGFLSADVAIEFTSPSSAYGNCMRAFEKGVKVVSGTTGWLSQHREAMEELCCDGKHTLFWASNFSVGVAIFSAVNRYLARLMNDFPQYDVKMSETHHVHKLDAPSGTALTLASQIEKEIERVERVEITSVREGEVPGIHSVSYDSDADMITITHDAHSRRGFALGAVMAAEYTIEHTGMLGMEDLFKVIKIDN